MPDAFDIYLLALIGLCVVGAALLFWIATKPLAAEERRRG